MTNREACKMFMKSSKESLDKINKMQALVSKNSILYKKEHNNAADCIQNALIIMAKTHSLNEAFFNDIQHIIDNHLESEEFWNWLKMTSIGHL